MSACVLVLSCLGGATTAHAQGFTPGAGSVWLKLGYIRGDASQNFAGVDERAWAPETDAGARVPFRSREGQVVGGALNQNQLTLDAMWAPRERVVVGLFLPALSRAAYSNTVNDYRTVATGLGDLNLFAGYQLTPTSLQRIGVTAYARVKAPLSRKFPYTNEALLGEGQVDLSGALASSFALLPALHLNAMIEYRHRFDFERAGQRAEVGDEVHGLLTLGGAPLSGLWLTAGYAGFVGRPWTVQPAPNAPTRTLQRAFHAAMVSAYLSALGDWVDMPGLALDAWLKLPLAGRDHAVMRSFGLGLAYGF